MTYTHLTHPKLLINQLNEGDILVELEVIHIKRNPVRWTITWKNIKTETQIIGNPAGKNSFVWEQSK
ncbi:MAG: hypothetical protein WC055_09945 [Melioribacteraceae bacterium]